MRHKATLFILQDLRDVIFGCQSRCPICSIKCTLSKGHQGNHTVLANCHILQAIGGVRVHATNTPFYGMCMSEKHLEEEQITKGDGNFHKTVDYTRIHYPEWYPYFK